MRRFQTEIVPSDPCKHKTTFDLRETILKEACSEEYPRSAICVQNFDDSLSFAIRITYRISLRSSSLREPRYPLLKVVHLLICFCNSSISVSVGSGVYKNKRLAPVKKQGKTGAARERSSSLTITEIHSCLMEESFQRRKRTC